MGIGASAGGLEALQQLFDKLPPDTDLAFVVVQHFSSDFKSLMDEIPANLVEDSFALSCQHQFLVRFDDEDSALRASRRDIHITCDRGVCDRVEFEP